MNKKLLHYAQLLRLDKPIGIFLLLWPTLWALWLASPTSPSLHLVFLFIAGVILMRSAGCVINDYADKEFDRHVSRTNTRPLANNKISVIESLILFSFLMLGAFLIVLQLNSLTVCLAVVAAALATVYPFLKRVTHWPQLGLGLAFAWSVPMAFAATQNSIPSLSWLIFLAAACWPVMYDTQYAMMDRDDDVKIGVKSTAIFFGKIEILFITLLQALFIINLSLIGYLYHLNYYYYLSLSIVAVLFFYQYSLIRNRDRDASFKAFLNNHWVGMVIFIGILLGK